MGPKYQVPGYRHPGPDTRYLMNVEGRITEHRGLTRETRPSGMQDGTWPYPAYPMCGFFGA